MASDGKAVIVTGAASGIGLAMAMGLLKAGHNVVATDRNAAALGELASSAKGLAGKVETVTADLEQPDSFALIAASALVAFGRIDALINNAGIGQAAVRSGERRPIRFWETTPAQWARFMAINGAGPINMARAVLPHMLDSAASDTGAVPPDFLSHSHGEGFLRFFEERLGRPGLYFFDEPESALSPQRQIEFLKVLRRMQVSQASQVIIATHSPLIMALPDAMLLRMTGRGLSPVSLAETDHFRLYREFCLAPETFLETMMDE